MSLAGYIYAMNNCELNNLAKNRFIDEETQIGLAECRHLMARRYLASNPNLCEEAKETLLSGRANSVKFDMIATGNLNDNPELISKVYNEAPTRMLNTMWRLGYTFIGGGWSRRSKVNTPTETLKDIYLTFLRPLESPTGRDSYHGNGYWAEHLASHPNTDEELAVIMSTSSCDRTKNAAFAKLVDLRNSKNEES